MAPIQIFSTSAINANKASGTTPQTADSQNPPTTTSTMTSTTTKDAHPPYPAARPGAPAVPAPTATAQISTPLQPTKTLNYTPTQVQSFPPPPQPAAAPMPFNAKPRTNLPPPPKAGEKYIPSSIEPTSPVQRPPQQVYMPPPTTAYRAQPPASTTSTNTSSQSSYPMPASQYEGGVRSVQGPPGYQQNPYASDLGLNQRRAQDTFGDDTEDESMEGATSLAEDASYMWNAAVSVLQKAGSKLSEAESEVWRRVNK